MSVSCSPKFAVINAATVATTALSSVRACRSRMGAGASWAWCSSSCTSSTEKTRAPPCRPARERPLQPRTWRTRRRWPLPWRWPTPRRPTRPPPTPSSATARSSPARCRRPAARARACADQAVEASLVGRMNSLKLRLPTELVCR